MEQNNKAVVIAVVEMENVYSTKHLRIGDEVVMNMDKEARGWGRKGPADGTKGQVVGFFEYLSTYNLNRDKNPGIYRGNGAAIVQWEDGTASSEGSDIAIPKAILDERRKDTVWNEAFEKMVKLYDLPDVDYMVGNVVMTTRGYKSLGRQTQVKTDKATITNIEFDEVINRRTGELLPREKWQDERIFHVDLESGGSTRVSINEMSEIIDKGNYWAWQNDKSQLKFKDLQEECGFYSSIGKRTQLRSPRSGNNEWTINDAVEAIRKGEIDLIGSSGSFFGSRPFTVVYKLDEDLAELAQRAREETIKGFEGHVFSPLKKYFINFTMPGTEHSIHAYKEFDLNGVKEKTPHGVLIIDGFEFDDSINIRPNWKPEDGIEVTSCKLNKIYNPEETDKFPDDAIDFFSMLGDLGWKVDWNKFPKNK